MVAKAGLELHVFQTLPAPPEQTAAAIPGLGMAESPAGWRLEARNLPGLPPALQAVSADTVSVDQAKVSFPLTLRHILPGDRFWPQGAPGLKKMQDFLVDAKVPRWLRPHLPLVAVGEEIVWVPGLRLAEPVKLTSASRHALELIISPTDPTTAKVWELILAFRQGKTGAA